ncbi:hypothetical protein QBC46DRAFT_401018 [Diplogelasinospora grovesii]|uniref:Uncharacterized protein n=1 Tax=Diplogelasinospora grovesii TaxID=303347 RepID=A0AAN6RYW1_9PEZI|nr:hypothetical protein QBC46DRAFT_401018 [Diplogelasinospora grovesii]
MSEGCTREDRTWRYRPWFQFWFVISPPYRPSWIGKKRRAAASMPDRCCSHCRHSHNPPHGPDGLVKLNLPMPLNEAPKSLSDWLSAQVTDEDWKTAYQAAAEIAVKLGYDLEWLHNNKTAGAGKLKEEGIMPGIAEQFVNKIMEWADKFETN